MDRKQHALVAASVAGLVAVAGFFSHGTPSHAEGEQIHCYGINKCKGTGECGGKGRSCAGTNECAGQGFLTLEKDTCLKIKDGRLTPEAS